MFDYVNPDIITVKAVDITPPPKPSATSILIEFLKEKFPYQTIESFDYTGGYAQPADWKAPELAINNSVIGWLQQNYTTFVPYSHPNARDEYKEVKLANPNFFNIFHKMAIYEFGYDPLKPGSRESYMACSIDEWEKFNPEIMKIYHSLKYKMTVSSSAQSIVYASVYNPKP